MPPRLKGMTAGKTSIPEGRAYLPKVPGVFPGGSVEERRRSRVLGGIRPGCLHRDPAVGPAPWAGVTFQDFNEVLGGQKTLLTSSRSNGAGGRQALDLGDHVVDAGCEGAAEIVPSLGLATEVRLTCAHQNRMVCDGHSLERPIRGCIL